MSNELSNASANGGGFPNVETLKESISQRGAEYERSREEKNILFKQKMLRASQTYYENLLQNIYSAIEYMKRSRNGNPVVYVNVPTSRLEWLSDEEAKIFSEQEEEREEELRWTCMECEEVRFEDARVEAGMKCGHCAYGRVDYDK